MDIFIEEQEIVNLIRGNTIEAYGAVIDNAIEI